MASPTIARVFYPAVSATASTGLLDNHSLTILLHLCLGHRSSATAEDCILRIAAVTEHEAQNTNPLFSFDLVTRVAVGNRFVIVLHLFSEGICILTKTIDTVYARDVSHVLARCRESLERRGISQFEDDSLTVLPVRKRAMGAH